MTQVQARMRDRKCIVCGRRDKRTLAGLSMCARCDANTTHLRPDKSPAGKKAWPYA